MPKKKKRSILQKIKEELPPMKKRRRQNLIAKAIKFAAENKNCLVVVGDLKTDDLIAAYNKHYMAATVHKKFLIFTHGAGIIKSIIQRKGNVAKAIDRFCQFVDAFLWNLSKKTSSSGSREGK